MDPLIIHHVIRHRLSRIETNDFQDKSGCSINGFRSFLFEEGIVRNRYDVENLFNSHDTRQDYRGYPIYLDLYFFRSLPLSDEILRMKNVDFEFIEETKPIHKLVSHQPHFVEEEKNLIYNRFFFMGCSLYKSDDVEDWQCFQMDCEGHLVSLKSYHKDFHLSHRSIEHLSNFPHLTNLDAYVYEEYVSNFSLLSNLSSLTIRFGCDSPKLLKDLGLFTNLLSLRMHNRYFSSKLFNLYIKSSI